MADPMILPIALLTTLACLMLNLWSDTRIGRARQLVGRGRADAAAMLAARQSAAASFHGNALFFLLLLALLELASVNPWLLAAAGIAFVAARGLLIAASGHAAGGPARWLAVTVTLAAQGLLVAIGVALATGARPAPPAHIDPIDAAARPPKRAGAAGFPGGAPGSYQKKPLLTAITRPVRVFTSTTSLP